MPSSCEEPLLLQSTEDGSPTLYSPRFSEHYHSTRGALSESRHVFIDHGLATLTLPSPIRVLEYGFGLGVNLLVALEWATRHDHSLEYTTLECYPVPLDLLATAHFEVDDNVTALWRAAHHAPWSVRQNIGERLTIQKVCCDFTAYTPAAHAFDIVFFDAFSPTHVPEQWSGSLFATIRASLLPHGLLVTYSASGLVKRALRDAGFVVKRCPGALGKHHMLQAFPAPAVPSV